MKQRFLLLTFVLAVVFAGAQEVTFRKAWNLDWSGNQVRCADGSVISFWEDTDAGDTDIYAQRIDDKGQLLWSKPKIVAGGDGVQKFVSCVKCSDNNFVLLFQCSGHGYRHGYSMQKMNSNGETLWGADGIEIIEGAARISIVPNEMGGVFVIYADGFSTHNVRGQNFDAQGNLLWPEEGLSLVSESASFLFQGALSDLEGGFIVNWNEGTGIENWTTQLYRFDADGAQIGEGPMVPPDVMQGGGRFEIVPDRAGGFLLWNRREEPTTRIAFQRMDSSGNVQFGRPFLFDLQSQISYYEKIPVEPLENGGLVFAWKKYNVNSDEEEIKAQRLAADFSELWGENGISAGTLAAWNTIGQIQVSPDAQGGAWFAWTIDDNMNPGVYTQYILPEGSPAWTGGAKVLSLDDAWRLQQPALTAFSDGALLIWRDLHSQNVNVRRQALDTNGTPYLAAGGETLVSRLDGKTFLAGVLPLGDKYLVMWYDDRDYYENIYYQICDQNENLLLEEHGRALPRETISNPHGMTAISLPDGTVAMLISRGSSVFLQRIKGMGEAAYPGDGLPVFTLDHMPSAVMEYDDSGLSVVWKRYDFSGPSQASLRFQKIVGSTLQWEAEGKTIVTLPAETMVRLIGLRDGYLIFETYSHDRLYFNCRVLKIDEQGEIDSNWPQEGLVVFDGCNYHSSAVVDGDLIIFGKSSADYSLKAQRLTSCGLRLWGDEGYSYGSRSFLSLLGGEPLSMLQPGGQGGNSMYYQMMDGDGNFIFDNSGILLEETGRFLYGATLLGFPNSSKAAIWATCPDSGGYRDIFMRFIKPNGELLDDGNITLCDAWLEQDGVQAVAHGYQALVAWNDGRSGILDSEYFVQGIYGSFIYNDYTSADDPQIPPLLETALFQNHPNPFNPETRLSFSLPAAGKTSLAIYNMKGQKIATLLDEEELPAGKHSLLWNGCDQQGNPVASGVYIQRLSFGAQTLVRKMVLAK